MPLIPFENHFPQVSKTAWVAPTAVIIGDVTIGEHSSIWFGTVLRGDMHSIRVGSSTNLQDMVVVHVTYEKHPTHIGSFVTVGHRAIIHGCHIEDGCLIGMGAIIMDGVSIGEESLIAAGTLIPPGKVIPPRSLVMGTPSRVIRTLDTEEIDSIRRNGNLYIDFMKRYQATEQLLP